MTLVDTSILVAASVKGHPRFRECVAVLDQYDGELGCSVHAFAETYSTLIAYPLPRRMTPSEVSQILEDLSKIIKAVALTPPEYLRMLRDLSGRRVTGGAVYDAIHTACARKLRAQRIYTLNTRDFKRVAPDLASIIQEP